MNSNNLKVVFIVGKTNDLLLDNMLQIEHIQNGDIIQGSFEDTYRNISYKTLTAWKWIIANCDMSSIRFVIKIDDDVILNVNYLHQVLNHSSDLIATPIFSAYSKPKESNLDRLKNSFVCNIFSGYRPDKNPFSKYYVKNSEYNSELYQIDFYSDYCFGPGYIITPDLIDKLYAQSSQIKLFWLEDVYVGILARYASAEFRNLDKEFYFDYDPSSVVARNNLKNRLFIRNIQTPDDFNKIWKLVRA